jgi:uncharacterized spore protein YtfJ
MNALDALNQAKDVITVRRVYGEPIQEDGLTIIPAASVMGGGGGGGDTGGTGASASGARAAGRSLGDQGRRGSVEAGVRPARYAFVV